jgi:hypothetical protein
MSNKRRFCLTKEGNYLVLLNKKQERGTIFLHFYIN